MIKIGKSYQNELGDWITIAGRVITNIDYFFSTEHECYNSRGEFLTWNKHKKQWMSSRKHGLNLYLTGQTIIIKDK